jgi:hypothetical protein
MANQVEEETESVPALAYLKSAIVPPRGSDREEVAGEALDASRLSPLRIMAGWPALS